MTSKIDNGLNPRSQGDGLLKVEDVAARLNCSTSFVYSILGKELKHYRLGKGQCGIRVSDEQLQDYLEGKEKGSDQPAPAAPRLKKFTPKHLRV
jgi:hypothetical protein